VDNDRQNRAAEANAIWQNKRVISEGRIEGTFGGEVPASRAFATTRWTVVQSASESASREADAALETLCRTYWPAIHTYVRRFGCSAEDCRDLTQAFFCRLLEKKWLLAADPQRGKFRTFLLSTLKHFLADERDRSEALKRGAGRPHLSLERDFDDDTFAPSDNASLDQIYDYQWAITVFDQCVHNLQQEFADFGKAADFEVLKEFVALDAAPVSQKEAAASLGISEAAAKMAVSRMRRRFRELLRAETASSCSTQRTGYLTTALLLQRSLIRICSVIDFSSNDSEKRETEDRDYT
jgi:DNA-directed RNA polymerase specialized sigma24 family protein